MFPDQETINARVCDTIEYRSMGVESGENPVAASDAATTELHRVIDAHVGACYRFRVNKESGNLQAANIGDLFRTHSTIGRAIHELKMACLDDVQRMHGPGALTP